ncbi:MAG: insulinase family protein [Lachnospiraceae bacterium]|nr:insulinase family protein [Lachnospiraceae bacterium]
MINFPGSYELIFENNLSDIGSMGYLLRHKKSGARISIIANDDENKVFSVGFRTPPADSTGVAHIIEHSVLCGSEKYPVKDPFVELVKGSLNTFLNAMTYSDKTVYPVASCNDADFANLMGVYLDAVFFPNIYDKKEIFLQEGWHYEMENEEAPLTINGVVYNEMRGVFSSADQLLARLVEKALFPDNAYSNESGGEPSEIPNLTYEGFLDFHRKYYHPSNSYIYLYGNMDVEDRLSFLDKEYLSKFDAIEVDSEIAYQKPFSETAYVTENYSAQSDAEKSYLSYNCVVDTSLNLMFQVAFQVLSYALVQVPGAPLKKKIMDLGIGEDISCSYDGEIYQPVFSIVLKEADSSRTKEFVDAITSELERIVKEGIDKDSLRAAIAGYEFRYREADYGRYPKGLMYGLACMQSWLYDENEPFSQVMLNDVYKKLKELIDTDYYEKLIKDYILDNPHKAIVSVLPEVGLSRKIDAELEKKLEDYKKALSGNEIKDIVKMTEHLHAYQEMSDTPEALETIPMLSVDDIKREISTIPTCEKTCGTTPVLYHDIRTNGIAYTIMSYDVKEYKEYIQYINLLTYILTYVDTKNYDYLGLSNAINLHTGGLQINQAVTAKSKDDYALTCEVCFSALYDELSEAFKLVHEVLIGSVINDKKRLKEIIQEARAEARASIEATGNLTTVERALSYISETAYYQGLIGQVGFYRFLDKLYNDFDECADNLIDILEKLVGCIFDKEKLLINITADEEGYQVFEKEYLSFENSIPVKHVELPKSEDTAEAFEKVAKKLNEGFKTSGKVQYVARGGNFISKKPYTGSLHVLKTILSYDYLWLKIRLQGGAYGAMCGFARSGNSYFVSYRDPNLRETNAVYDSIPDYLESFDANEREMTKYIIGTMSGVDAPATPRIKGRTAYTRYLSGFSDEKRQKERDEILATDAAKVRELAEYVRAILDDECICVVGGADKIESCSDMFENVKELL